MSFKPIVADGFEDRWAAWQARGEAHDRTSRRRLIVLAVVCSLAAAILSVW